MSYFSISGNIIDIHEERFFPGIIHVEDGRIVSIEEFSRAAGFYILPGLVDSHVHIESSMLVPSEFARIAVTHGTVATVSDPHEIANVLGIDGIKYMLENSSKVLFKFYFGASSCVPATSFETAGAMLTPADIETLFKDYNLKYFSEMMNYPGVLNDDPEVLEKLKIAQKYGRPVDGHAPGLKGEQAKKYIEAGISTDHECFTLDEAIDKIYYGMKILIREGSAAKNFDTLYKLIEARPDMCMLCSDDKHPDDLLLGHINLLIKRCIALGFDLFKVLKVAVRNPVLHYGLDVGMLRVGDPADFIIIDNPDSFNVIKTFIDGNLVAEGNVSYIEPVEVNVVNNFNCKSKTSADFAFNDPGNKVRVIEALNGQIVTESSVAEIKCNGSFESDVEHDVLKITVVNRYADEKPAVAFIRNFGLEKGAIASSVAHDSHNIVAVGVSDEAICKAVNAVIENKGGLSLYDGATSYTQALPVAGLMALEDCTTVGKKYSELTERAKKLGTKLDAPYMTLSFMALLVIPKLKLSDKGLFDGEKFEFANVIAG